MEVTTLVPTISVLRAKSRLRTETSWLDSWHCFSYGRFHEPDNTHHGLLLVSNDDRILGGTGFGELSHRDIEIVTWMVEGELEHRDSEGHVHVLRPGMVRRLSAGTGLRRTEMNPAAWTPVRAVEMWVPPDREGLPPDVEVADVTDALAGGGLVPVASALPDTPGVHLNQPQAALWAGRLRPGESVTLPDAPHVHLYVVFGGGILDTGSLAGAGPLAEGDSARLTAAGSPVFEAGSAGGAELLVWETG